MGPPPWWWGLALLLVILAAILMIVVVVQRARGQRRAQAIAERERRFSETILESLPGIMYLYDTSGRFLRWNAQFLRVSGYSAAELATMHPLDFYLGDDKARVRERIDEVFAGAGEATVEASFVARDGTATPYFFTGRRITWEGTPCLIGMGVDVSQRAMAERALRESEARYHTTLDRLSEGCQILSHDWEYLYLNDAAVVHNRRSRGELLGRTMPEVWPGIEETEVFALLRGAMTSGEARHAEIEYQFADGSRHWYDVRCQPVPEGIFVLSIDIDDRKQIEAELADVREGLERTVDTRTAELQRALVRAEAADRLKSAFLATMSHELRTPLNSILGFTGLMLQELPGPLVPEQARQLGMVRTSARHLLDLINDVLDISKIEAGQLEVRVAPFAVQESVARVVAIVQPAADAKRLTLRVELPEALPPIVSDRRRVDQILLNLLHNAVKFTERGGVVLRVEVGLPGDPSAPWIRCRVTDTGIGIADRDLGALFTPFRQVDTGLSRQHEGTGLGLAISRRLATLLGGTIEAESVVGSGSDFTLTLPLAVGAEAT
jgi:PAS domain S-box-containing protein